MAARCENRIYRLSAEEVDRRLLNGGKLILDTIKNIYIADKETIETIEGNPLTLQQFYQELIKYNIIKINNDNQSKK